MKTLRDQNRKPTHPGAVLREDVLPDLGWTQGELANRSHVTVHSEATAGHSRVIFINVGCEKQGNYKACDS